MKRASKILLKQFFKEYYFINSETIIKNVKRIHQREIAYVSYETGKIIRHIGVKDPNELVNLLVEDIPLHLYHSVAYYLFPEREMEKKILTGCDLVFDIDVDKLLKKGAKPRKFFICQKCCEIYQEDKKRCERCGESLREVDWIDGRNLEIAKKEAEKLFTILTEDFGISEKNIEVYFSGSRGYHIHVYGKEIENLDLSARLEIVDYVKLSGYDLNYEAYNQKRTFKVLERILKGEEDIGQKLSEKEKEELERIVSEEDKIQYAIRKMSKDLRIKIEEYIREKEGVEIDPVVTTDIHRLIRFPESIHGSTGFIKHKVEDLISFNPLKDAVFPSDKRIWIFVKYSPKIALINKEFGPFFKEKVLLPAYLAIYLMCKGLAEIE